MNWFGVLAHHAIRTPDKAITVFEGQTTSYAAMAANAAALADGLAGHGVGRGDVVALLSQNCPGVPRDGLCGQSYLGAIAMPINWRLAAPEVAYILEHSGARVLICGASLTEVADQAVTKLEPAVLRACITSTAPEGWTTVAALRRAPSAIIPTPASGRRRAPAHVYLGHHGTSQGRHAHPCQPGLEKPGAHRGAGLHRFRYRAGLWSAVPRRRAGSDDHLPDRDMGAHSSSSTVPSRQPRSSPKLSSVLG